MSVVGMIHINCNYIGRCGKIYAVDAENYLTELTELAIAGNGTYTYPKRYCPHCERAAKYHGYESDRARDERHLNQEHNKYISNEDIEQTEVKQ